MVDLLAFPVITPDSQSGSHPEAELILFDSLKLIPSHMAAQENLKYLLYLDYPSPSLLTNEVTYV